jgi:hypothetical protein
MLGDLKLIAALVAAAVALAGCGGDDDEPEVPPVDRKPERPEQVSGLPSGWTVEENKAQGFELGAPPGWRSGGDCLKGGAPAGPVTILCSPDKLVTLSVAADRTDEALELEPGEFAVRTMVGLAEGYDRLEPGKPRPFKARYPGASVEGTGEAVGTGVRQDVTVVVVRREGAANFTAVIAANADKPTEPAVKLAEEALTTLRSQPVGVPDG